MYYITILYIINILYYVTYNILYRPVTQKCVRPSLYLFYAPSYLTSKYYNQRTNLSPRPHNALNVDKSTDQIRSRSGDSLFHFYCSKVRVKSESGEIRAVSAAVAARWMYHLYLFFSNGAGPN